MLDDTAVHPIERQLLDHWPHWTDVLTPLRQAVACLVEAWQRDALIMTCGNGGSAADSGHIVGELVKSFRCKRPVPAEQFTSPPPAWAGQLEQGFRAVSLPCASASVSAIANDIGAEMVYAQQVWALARPGDVLIALSTSGHSANVIRAMEVAKHRDCTTLGLTGRKQAVMDQHADIIVHAPADETCRIQEHHLAFYHALCAMAEQQLFG